MATGVPVKDKIILLLVVLVAFTASAYGEEDNAMKIKLSTGNKTLTATMLDNATSRDFMLMLPLTLALRDYAGTEKISDLPRTLSTRGAPAGHDPAAGDITLYAPWGNLAIFYREFGYSRGLIILGKMDAGIDTLSQLDGDVLVDRME